MRGGVVVKSRLHRRGVGGVGVAQRILRLWIESRCGNWRGGSDPYGTNPYNRRHADPEANVLVWTPWQSVDIDEGAVKLEFEMVPPGVTLVQVAAQ